MSKRLSDFSQLSKAMLKTETPPPKAEVAKSVPPAPEPSKLSREEEEVLAYFSRSSLKAPVSPRVAPRSTPAGNPPAAATPVSAPNTAAYDILSAEKESLSSRLEELSCQLSAERDAHAAALRDLERIRSECARLRGELDKASQTPAAVDAPAPAFSPAPVTEQPVSGILAVPAALVEAFPGELREMVLSVLSDARDAAAQSTRERRAAVLSALLAANKSTGELDRRRTELKQILKDAGYYTDPSALSALGFKLISGRTHWKLEYAGIRMPLAKTPSDYRANLNMTSDMANRCF